MEKEWSKLEKPLKGRPACWDTSGVKSKGEVMQRGRDEKIEIHFGSIKAICHIKNHELGKAYWVYKGRIVFRGDLVKDETGHKAVFTEQGTTASYMAGTKFLDVIARFPGMSGQDADATSAFTQITLEEASKILGVSHVPETWISLPKDRWPDEWHKGVKDGTLIDPVCPLVTNLYGHPLAGLLWDKCSQERIQKCGFKKVEGWESLYVHPEKQLFLGVYVDDFHLCGKTDNLAAAWADLKKHIDFGEVSPFDGTTYLGCTQDKLKISDEDVQTKHDLFSSFLTDDTSVSAQDFEAKPIKLPPVQKKLNAQEKRKAKELTQKLKKKLKPTKGSKDEEFLMIMNEVKKTEVRGWYYQMKGAAQACVTRYLELAQVDKSTLQKVGTPCLDDHMLAPEDFESKGVLSSVCSQAVLKCLYMTRLARPELYWAVNSLAREVTKWTVACDRRLHRLISYIHCHEDAVMKSWVGNKASECKLMLFCDASFAGDLKDSKSTSGSLLCIVGSHTFCPITWLCKKQGAVSHSSTEAEIIALDTGLRIDGLPAMTLWDLVINVLEPIKENVTPAVKKINLLPPETQELMNVDYMPTNIPELSKRCKLIIMEDNDAVIKMCMKVRAPTMRHVARTHRINVDTLLERIHHEVGICIKYVNTKLQIADIFTKGSFTVQTWNDLCKLFAVGPL